MKITLEKLSKLIGADRLKLALTKLQQAKFKVSTSADQAQARHPENEAAAVAACAVHLLQRASIVPTSDDLKAYAETLRKDEAPTAKGILKNLDREIARLTPKKKGEPGGAPEPESPNAALDSEVAALAKEPEPVADAKVEEAKPATAKKS